MNEWMNERVTGDVWAQELVRRGWGEEREREDHVPRPTPIPTLTALTDRSLSSIVWR